MHARSLALSIAATLGLGATLACDTTPPGPTVKWGAASPDPTITTLLPATFGAGSGVRDAVKAECKLDFSIPEKIAARSPVVVTLAQQPDGGARVLYLEITHVHAPGGGPWSGPKAMSLHGDLVVNGAPVASFDARRTTTRGGSNCEMLDNIVEALAKDIRPWLAQPTAHARLGEL